MKVVVTCFAAALFLAACAAPINQRTAQNYDRAGDEAVARGDLPQAKEMFTRALINAELGHLGDAAEAYVLMKLGRVYGNLCQYDLAEKAFLDARDREARVHANNPERTFPVRAELGQLSYDIGRYQKAVVYFDEAFAVAGGRLKEADPATYAAVRTDYADALAKTGKADKARDVMAEVEALKGKTGTAKVGKGADYVRYPDQCPAKVRS